MLLLVMTLSAQDAETNLKKAGIILEPPSAPVANYVNAVRVDNLLFLAGKGPQAARLTAINHLAVLKHELGSLNKVKRIVKVHGMVNCTEDFKDQSKVINGYSDLMVEIFGERGKHARAAVGMYALPLNIAVEIEAIVEIAE